MDHEFQEDFNHRLSRWIASQGFWFQLRHSITSSGAPGTIAYHMLRLSFRVLVFLAILVLCALVYLVKRTGQNAFRDDLRQSISVSIGASQLAMSGTKRGQGGLEISRIASEGGPDTFFEFLEIRNLSCRMALLDGLVGVWDVGTISIDRLDMILRAGADNPEYSARIGEILFQDSPDIRIRNIDIAKANISWGYSERTRGRIENTNMRIRRDEDGWRITMRGGVFSQNWLRDLEVAEIIVICTPSGIVFEKTDLRQGEGSVDFAGLRVSAGDRPQVHGVAKVHGIALERILPPAVGDFADGRISGDFTVSGSTNTIEGVGFDGRVVLGGANRLVIRDQFRLLRALSVVDMHNSYRRLDFHEGSFRLTTNAGQMLVRDIHLVAGDLATISGSFRTRQPTGKELDAIMARGDSSRGIGGLASGEESDEKFLLNMKELERQFSLRQFASASRRAQDTGGMDDESELFDRIGLNYEALMFAEQQAARLSRMLIYEGDLVMTLLPNTFDRTETLRSAFPPDPESGRIHLRISLAGPLHELTKSEAERLHELGRR